MRGCHILFAGCVQIYREDEAMQFFNCSVFVCFLYPFRSALACLKSLCIFFGYFIFACEPYFLFFPLYLSQSHSWLSPHYGVKSSLIPSLRSGRKLQIENSMHFQSSVDLQVQRAQSVSRLTA